MKKHLFNFNQLFMSWNEKQKPRRFGQYAAMLIMLLTLGVGQMWAKDWYVRGSLNSWGATKMNQSSADANFYYLEVTGSQEFKITSANDSWADEKGSGAIDNTAGYIISLGGSGNITGGGSGETWYICYNSSTSKVFGVFAMNVAGDNWGSPAIGSWTTTGAKMTFDGKNTFTKTISSVAASQHKVKITRYSTASSNWDNAVGYSSKVSCTNAGSPTSESGSDGGNIQFTPYVAGSVTLTYNRSTGNISIACTAPTVTFDKEGGAGGTDSQSTPYGTATSSITAPSKTGYNFGGYYDGDNGTGNQVISASGVWQKNKTNFTNNDATCKWVVTSNRTLYAKWTAKNYNLTLKGNGGSDGAVTTTYNSSSTTSFSESSRASYSCDGYYTAKSSGSLVLNADGSIPSSTVSNYLSSGKWVGDTVTVLWAHWTYDPTLYDVTFGVGTSYTSLGSLSATAGGDGISSGDDIAAGTEITFTASPITGYKVDGFYSDASCESVLQSGATTSYTIASLGANTTVYVKFIPITYTITYNLNSGSNPGGAPTSYTIKDDDVTLPTPTRSYYTFEGWYANSGLTGDAVTTIASGSTGNKTYWAKWSENMTDVTLAASPVGAGTFTIEGAAKTSTTAGKTTTRSVTAVAGNGYYLTGTIWSKSNSSITLSSTTTNPTTVTGCGTAGTSSTLTATFTPIWYLKGDFNSWGETHPFVFTSATSGYVDVELDDDSNCKLYKASESDWYGTQYGFEKGTRLTTTFWTDNDNNCPINITGLTGTWRFTLDISGDYPSITATPPTYNQLRISAASPTDATNTNNFDLVEGSSNNWSVTRSLKAKTTYTFKIVYDSEWYGKNSTALTRASASASSLSTSGADMTITTDAAGDYTFTFNSSSKNLTVTYPTAYTITYGVGTHNGSSTAVSVSPSFTSGDYVLPETDVTFSKGSTKAGYTWKGWYSNNDGTGTLHSSTDANLSWTATRTGNISVYACYNLVSYGITYDNMSGAVNNGSNPASYTIEDLAVTLYSPSKTGYIFGNWKAKNSSGTTVTSLAVGSKLQDTTLYATWTPITYSIQFYGNGSTSGSMDNQTGIAYDSETTITANAFVKTGYNFAGWATTADGSVVRTDGAAHGNLTSTNGATVKLYAKWTPKQSALTLDYQTSAAGYYSSGSISNTEGLTGTYDSPMTALTGTMPSALPGYAFMGFYDATGGGGTKYYNADGSSAHNWDKNTESGTTLYAYYQKAEFTELQHAETVAKGDVITLDVNPVLNVTPVNYTAICWTLHYLENDNEVPTSGDHYYSVAANPAVGKPAQVRFTMTNLAVGSYYVKAVLKASASSSFDPCSTGTLLDTETGEFSIIGSSTVTIRYMDDSGNVIASSGSVVIEAGSTAGVKAPNIIGYTFHEWSLGAGVTNTCADGTSCGTGKDSINISSPYDGVITIFYTKKQMIYFNNTLGWDDVYVYFYNTSKEYWANNYGTGANKKQYFDGQYPFGNGYYGHMTHIEGTDVWYFDYQAASIPTLTKVAFANKDQNIDKSGATNAEAYFHDASVVYRTDFDASHLSMFVPIDAVQYDYTANTGSTYYHGYWINYPENTGYKLMIFDGTGGSALYVKDQDFTHNANKRMPMSISLELEGGKTYGFKIYRNDATWWGNNGTMKNGASGDGSQTVWEFTTGASSNCGLMTTSSGIYTFTLNYGQDRNSAYNYLVGVRYPESVGDFRLQYKDNINSTWKTSTVIPAVTKSDTISYFVRKASTPYIRVQKCTEVDGSGNPTWSNQSDGANIISSLPSEITADGVYNFIFSKSDGALVLDTVASYTGNFYIRVGADGDLPWDNYRVSSQIMPFSEYSFNQTTNPYSHYFTKYYRTMNDDGTAADPSSINVTFVVANDYSTNISDTIKTDDTGTSYVNSSGILSGNNANIRFMYNYKTNVATRRYLDDAQGPRATDFLLLIPSNSSSIYTAEDAVSGESQVQLSDKGNWVYEANVWVVPGTEYQVKATFGRFGGSTITQYLKGAASGDHQYETLIGGEGDSRLQIRLLYDFKTNRVIAAYLPSGTINTNLEIDADIMFVREHQGNVTQITFGENKSISEIHNVYSVLRFNKSTINDYALSRYERDLFYVSFPYDVRVSDIIGFGTYGKHWIIEYYDGAARAEKGFWSDSKSFWTFVTPDKASSFIMKAGTGYIVALDLDEMDNYSDVWANTSTVELIFPGDITSISNQEVTYTMPSHQCNINRGTTQGDRRIKDSHWNVLGVPAYHNTTGSFANHSDVIGEEEQVWSAENAPKYLYTWNMTDNSLTITNASGYNYKAMNAYIVQYYGDVTFHTSTNAAPASVAARTYADAPRNVDFRLEIQQNDVTVDQTFVQLSDEEGVSSEFVFGEDMSKEFNKNKANIYTMISSILNDTATVTEAAGNTLPMSEQTTIIPVGVKIATDGEYTFAISDGTSGVGVTLIDNVANTRTNLGLTDYTVNLNAGTIDGRFILEISPISQNPTDVELINGENGANGVRKVIIDQKMYIIRGNEIFDARGEKVK